MTCWMPLPSWQPDDGADTVVVVVAAGCGVARAAAPALAPTEAQAASARPSRRTSLPAPLAPGVGRHDLRDRDTQTCIPRSGGRKPSMFDSLLDKSGTVARLG